MVVAHLRVLSNSTYIRAQNDSMAALMLLYPSNGKFDGLRVRAQWAHQSPDFAGQ
jgi:hypothetical protein